MIKRRKGILCLMAALAVSLGAAASLALPKTAFADGNVLSGLDTFKMQDGVTLRLAATDDVKDGIRFSVQLGEETVKKLVSAEVLEGGTDQADKVKMYGVIAPADLISGDDFSAIERSKWLEIDESKIYFKSDGYYYADMVLANVKEANRHREFTARAVLECEGETSVWADLATEGYRNRSLYYAANKVALKQGTDLEVMLGGGTTYATWYGTADYPVVVETEEELGVLADCVSAGVGDFESKNIAVSQSVKSLEAFTSAIAEGGALASLSAELQSQYYDVTFKSEGKTLYSYKVKSGAIPAYKGWTFSAKVTDELNNTVSLNGWDKTFVAATADAVYNAAYGTPKANNLHSNFLENYNEKKTINGNEKTVSTIAGISIADRYPAATFTNTYDWAAGKALTFSVYNNSTEYEFCFGVFMKKTNNGAYAIEKDNKGEYVDPFIGFVLVEPNQTQTFTVYAEDFDYSVYKYLAVSTSHYMCSCGKTVENAIDDDAKAEKDFFAFNVSLYDFKFETKAKPSGEDYVQATTVTDSDANESLNVNGAYVHGDGAYSYAYTPYGNHPFVYFDFTRSYDWTKISAVSFFVYNPSQYVYYVNVNATNGNTTAVGTSKKTVELPAKQWTEIVFDTKGLSIAENSAIMINTSYDAGRGAPNTNSGVSGLTNTSKWRAFRLYIDDFTVTEKDMSDDNLWSNGVQIASYNLEKNTSAQYIHGEGKYSLWAKASGTWNAFVFSDKCVNYKTDAIKQIKFYVFNPSQTTSYYINAGSCTAFTVNGGWNNLDNNPETTNIEIKANQWTEVVLDTSAWVDGSYLFVRCGVRGNNPNDGDELWTEFKQNGLFFDDFTLVK